MNIQASTMDELINAYADQAEGIALHDPVEGVYDASANNRYTWLGLMVSFARDMVELQNRGKCEQHDEAKKGLKFGQPVPAFSDSPEKGDPSELADNKVTPYAGVSDDDLRMMVFGYAWRVDLNSSEMDDDGVAEIDNMSRDMLIDEIRRGQDAAKKKSALLGAEESKYKGVPWQHLIDIQQGESVKAIDVARSYGLDLNVTSGHMKYNLITALLEKWRKRLTGTEFTYFERFLNEQSMAWVRVFFAYEDCKLAEVNKEG